MEENNIIIGIGERPSVGKWFVLSFQHVFAMFGATILVPILTGLPVGTALLASGIGTLIYILLTKAKCPMYLGSSFAFIYPVQVALAVKDGAEPNFATVCTSFILVGLVYCVVALLIKLLGKGWLDKILPPVVVGPMIIVIGLGLAGSACGNAGLIPSETGETNWQFVCVAIVAVLVTAVVAVYAKGFFKIVPIISGIIVGYVFAIIIDLIFNRGEIAAETLVLGGLKEMGEGFKSISSFSEFLNAIFEVPKIMLPFGNGVANRGPFVFYSFDFSSAAMIVPLAFVTIAEHIGDHKVLGTICGKDFINDPGLDRTLAGDGIATAVAGMIGGPANTSYGENTGVVGMTKVASVWVTGGAAIFAIIISFVKPIKDLINTIPGCVMGGICIILFGFIAANGIRVLVDSKVDFSSTRNIVIASVMLVLGLGGAAIRIMRPSINLDISISGMAIAAIAGIILNLVLPVKKADKATKTD